MVSSSIVADIRGLIEACFVTNLDWYDSWTGLGQLIFIEEYDVKNILS